MFSAATKSARVATAANYIENVFSTYLYTGNGSSQTITNGIDLSTYGGLVWTKIRSVATGHALADTAQGVQKILQSNNTLAQQSYTGYITSFNSNGYTFGDASLYNDNLSTFVSWTFRKQPKFFDIVTYTGDGTTTQTINHNLGCQPGFILLKATSSSGSWFVLARSDATNYKYLFLNSTNGSGGNYAQTSCASATQINLGYIANNIDSFFNLNGTQYVAYLFAHNAGGFGLTGTDNVISCGSFTTDGSGNATVNLGYEPQWLLTKLTSPAGDPWVINDTMRGFSNTGFAYLYPNTSSAEAAGSGTFFVPTATGFNVFSQYASGTYIYIAIRRGPMKTPTSGTSVFSPQTWTGNNTAGRNISTGFPVDLTVEQIRANSAGVQANLWFDRLRGYSSTAAGNSYYLRSQATGAEFYIDNYNYVPTMDGFNFGSVASGGQQFNSSLGTAVAWNFRRAPGFFDEVCYTGDGTGGSGRAITHNLGVAPELVIVKSRSNTYDWRVWQTSFGTTYNILLNSSAAQNANFYLWANTYLAVTNPTTQFGVYGDGTTNSTNTSGATYVAYLFASCPGVSKVGSYTGNGSTQTINCGFTGGARFVLIKRVDATGDWYVYDTARGMTTLTDPYLLLNSSAAEVATLGSVTTVSTGFALNASILAAINTNGASYIFLAIA